MSAAAEAETAQASAEPAVEAVAAQAAVPAEQPAEQPAEVADEAAAAHVVAPAEQSAEKSAELAVEAAVRPVTVPTEAASTAMKLPVKAETPLKSPVDAEAGHLLAALRATPARAPELLAVAAVHRLAAETIQRTEWLRSTYPAATDDGLARLAAAEYTRKARAEGALAGFVGPAAVLVETGALLWLQAGMVLRIAAAYGHDPAAPERAAELLVLQGFHADVSTAEAAIAGRARTRKTRMAVRAVARAVLAKLLPAPLIASMTSARLTEQLAMRATVYYKRAKG